MSALIYPCGIIMDLGCSWLLEWAGSFWLDLYVFNIHSHPTVLLELRGCSTHGSDWNWRASVEKLRGRVEKMSLQEVLRVFALIPGDSVKAPEDSLPPYRLSFSYPTVVQTIITCATSAPSRGSSVATFTTFTTLNAVIFICQTLLL